MLRTLLLRRASAAALSIGAAMAAAAAHAAISDAAAPDPSNPVEVVPEVVVRGAANVPLNSTFSAGVITQEAVENLSPGASTTIQTLLNQTPSIFVYTNGPLGMSTTTNFRAFNSGQFSETIDGLALNDAFNGGVTGQADNQNNVILTVNDISSVQVYRGINNPAVNSYDSLGGTVNYVSRAPAPQFGVEASVSYGTFNTSVDRISINTGDFHGLTQVLSYEVGSSDGWQQQTPDRNLNLYYASNYHLDDKNLFTFRLSSNYNSGYEPQAIPLPVLDEAGYLYDYPRSISYYRDHDDNILGIAGWYSRVLPNLTVDQKVFFGESMYNRYSLDGNLAYNQGKPIPTVNDLLPDIAVFTPGTPMPYRTPAYSSRASQADHHYEYRAWETGYNLASTLTLPFNLITVGGNFTYARLISREFFGPNDQIVEVVGTAGNDFWDENDHRTYASAYVQDEISLLNDRLKVTPGVKYLYASTYDYDAASYYGPDGSAADTEHYVSPTIGGNFIVVKDLSIYAAYGQNVKFPDISAYYDNTPNNTNNGLDEPLHVKPEYVTDIETGVRYEHGGFYTSLDYYNETFKNTFISVTDPVTLNSTTTNGPKSTYNGWEFEAKYDTNNLFGGVGHVFFNYARNYARYVQTSDSGLALQSNRLANIPNELANAGFSYYRSGWRVSLDGRYVGNQVLNDQFTGVGSGGRLAPYFVMNGSISKLVTLPQGFLVNQFKLALNGDNLLNRKYYNNASTSNDYFGNQYVQVSPAAPQSFIVTVTVAY